MKFSITADGKHPATLEIKGFKGPDFIGTLESAEYGAGNLSGTSPDGKTLKGTVSLAGRTADFHAQLSDSLTTITGKISYGWFFSMDFTGTAVA